MMSLPIPEMIRIGSRDSILARLQAKLFADAVLARWPDKVVELLTFKTKGDQILDKALSKIGDKGLFIKELEYALLDGSIDVAIHSMKDLPGNLLPAFSVQSILTREDPCDVMLSRLPGVTFERLPRGAVIGTSSLRREAQLRVLRQDLQFQVIRGNLQRRYDKLLGGQYDAIILAGAGVKRLSWGSRIADTFDPLTQCIPAVCQGILAAEFLTENRQLANVLKQLQDEPTEIAQQSERAFLSAMEGGCQLPLGAYSHLLPEENRYQLIGTVLAPDGSKYVTETVDIDTSAPALAGESLAERILSLGGREILAGIHRNS